MKTAAAITYELDDLHLAVDELEEQLRHFVLEKNSMGLLFCDSIMDHEALIAELEQRFPFEIAGCTSVGFLHREAGFHDACITLTVMTADDCDFSVTMSDPITPQTIREASANAYLRGVGELEYDPKLIIAYPPYRLDVVFDDYPDVLGEVSGGLPVFGGYPSRVSGDGANLLLAKGATYEDQMLLILIGGNVRPVFAANTQLSNKAQQKRTITSADNNVLHRVGDTSFIEFLQGVGMITKDYDLEDNSYTYLSSPLVVESPYDGVGEREVYLRAIHSLNTQDGSATLIGRAPEGATLSVGALTRHDIRHSTQTSIDELNRQIVANQEDGYRYTLVLCTSCMARFMIMAPDTGMEGKVLVDSLPGPQALSGFYSFGELCPTSVREAGAANRAHSQTIVLCAI